MFKPRTVTSSGRCMTNPLNLLFRSGFPRTRGTLAGPRRRFRGRDGTTHQPLRRSRISMSLSCSSCPPPNIDKEHLHQQSRLPFLSVMVFVVGRDEARKLSVSKQETGEAVEGAASHVQKAATQFC